MTLAGFFRRLREPWRTWETARASEAHLSDLYRTAHEKGVFCGKEWEKHLPHLERWISSLAERSIIDYGCGPSGGVQCRYPHAFAYDPYVSRFAVPVEGPVEVFLSIDVLEHVASAALDRFWRDLKRLRPQWVYLTVSTRKAKLRLPNGANAHLTVRSPRWWRREIKRSLSSYDIEKMRVNSDRKEVSFYLRPLDEVSAEPH